MIPLVLLLTNCKTAQSVTDKGACPSIKEFTNDENKALGRELTVLGNMPDMPNLKRVVMECRETRKYLRKCKG